MLPYMTFRYPQYIESVKNNTSRTSIMIPRSHAQHSPAHTHSAGQDCSTRCEGLDIPGEDDNKTVQWVCKDTIKYPKR